MLWVCAEVSVKFVTEISCFWCTDCRKAVKDILCLYIGTLNHHGRYQNLKVTYFQCSVVFSVRCCRFVKGFITTFVLFPYYLPSRVYPLLVPLVCFSSYFSCFVKELAC